MSPSPDSEVQSFVDAYRAVRTRKGREARGLFSLEGTRLVERALRAPWPLSSVLLSETFAQDPRTRKLCDDLRAQSVRILTASTDVFAPLLEGRTFGEILALAPCSAGASKDLALPTEPSALILAAVDIEDPGNTGALIRTAHASGAAAFFSVGLTQPYHPKAVRTSMGSLFRLPCFEFAGLEEALAALPADAQTFAASAREDARELPKALENLPVSRTSCLLVGNEAHGLDDAAHRSVDYALRIPMPPGTVDSFSVNAAAAILLYALRTRDLS